MLQLRASYILPLEGIRTRNCPSSSRRRNARDYTPAFIAASEVDHIIMKHNSHFELAGMLSTVAHRADGATRALLPSNETFSLCPFSFTSLFASRRSWACFRLLSVNVHSISFIVASRLKPSSPSPLFTPWPPLDTTVSMLGSFFCSARIREVHRFSRIRWAIVSSQCSTWNGGATPAPIQPTNNYTDRTPSAVSFTMGYQPSMIIIQMFVRTIRAT